MLERVSLSEDCESLRKYIDCALSAREAQIVRLRYGLNGQIPCTQHEVAAICGISRSYVSRIEKKALEKLKEEFEKGEKRGETAP